MNKFVIFSWGCAEFKQPKETENVVSSLQGSLISVFTASELQGRIKSPGWRMLH